MNSFEPGSDASRSAGGLGVIAGGGDLPRRVAEAARASGRSVAVVALEGFADPWVERYRHIRAGVGEIGKIFDFFHAQNVGEVAFAGVVKRPSFASLKVDSRGAALLPRAVAAALRGDDALLRMVVGAFEEQGFTVASPEALDGDLLAEPGTLGAHAPTPEHAGDIMRAFEVARAIGALDIGQGAVVCDGVVLAVEAQEGTDRMLARVLELPESIRGTRTRRRGVLVKAPKPIQDLRIDLPTLGVDTILGVERAGLAGVAIEAGGALILDRDAVRRAADAAAVFVWIAPKAP
jgi:DUF1009 family protein